MSVFFLGSWARVGAFKITDPNRSNWRKGASQIPCRSADKSILHVDVTCPVATHFEKITHFEKNFSKWVKFGTSLTHFEKFFQSGLNLGPAQRTLKKNSKWFKFGTNLTHFEKNISKCVNHVHDTFFSFCVINKMIFSENIHRNTILKIRYFCMQTLAVIIFKPPFPLLHICFVNRL